MTKYLVTAHYDNFDISCETYDMDDLIKFLNEHDKVHQDVIDALTGELLYDGNNPSGKDFIKDQFWCAVAGWNSLEDSESKPDPKEKLIQDIMEVCEEFGVELRIPI